MHICLENNDDDDVDDDCKKHFINLLKTNLVQL